MKLCLSFILLSFLNISFCQSVVDIKEIEGVWIAEDFYNSFEKTLNIHESKNDFAPTYPVALRINSKEIYNRKLNIGYAELHDHMLHPEVSKFEVVKNDTIRERSFEINISKPDSLNYFLTSRIYYFNYDCKAYLSWDKNSLKLYRPADGDLKSETINYKRISNNFTRNNKFPNPLYFYTRNRILVGNYVLKDYEGEILTRSLKIKPNGLVKGYSRFKKMYAYYSTDIYCGPQTKDQLLMLWDGITREDTKGIHFVLERPNSRTIFLYETYPRYDYEPERELGKPKYILEMK